MRFDGLPHPKNEIESLLFEAISLLDLKIYYEHSGYVDRTPTILIIEVPLVRMFLYSNKIVINYYDPVRFGQCEVIDYVCLDIDRLKNDLMQAHKEYRIHHE